MPSHNLTSSLTVSGDIEVIYEALRNALEGMGFKESSSSAPSGMELKRGKGGLLTTKIQDCKTVLHVSLKEAASSDEVDILFEYFFDVPGIFTDADRQSINGELLKIKHVLFDTPPSGKPKFLRSFKTGQE